MDPGLAYMDASAFVKLVVQERESDALSAAIRGWRLTSSALLEVEAVRAVRRRKPGHEDAARALLRIVDVIDVGNDVRRAAADVAEPRLRSLDAIHLATALSLGDRCGAVFTYDDRLIAAAQAHGLPVTVPQP
jgi:predicted nucleic acid-binding protein